MACDFFFFTSWDSSSLRAGVEVVVVGMVAERCSGVVIFLHVEDCKRSKDTAIKFLRLIVIPVLLLLVAICVTIFFFLGGVDAATFSGGGLAVVVVHLKECGMEEG
ncbi:uncharacterized protein DS421_8g243510 [Arachis hypogaea]|nr:uncharacterized protein DS421_8g243510 [Arachis hypogaea]